MFLGEFMAVEGQKGPNRIHDTKGHPLKAGLRKEKIDSEATVGELKEKIRDFCDRRNWNQGTKDLLLALFTEVSELAEPFRFRSDKQISEILSNPEKRKEIEKEMADVFWFLLLFSARHDMPLAPALLRKLDENGARYPEDKIKGQTEYKKYNEL